MPKVSPNIAQSVLTDIDNGKMPLAVAAQRLGYSMSGTYHLLGRWRRRGRDMAQLWTSPGRRANPERRARCYPVTDPIGAGVLRQANPPIEVPADPSDAICRIALNAATAHADRTGTSAEDHIGEAWIAAHRAVHGTEGEWRNYGRMRLDNELHVTARTMRDLLRDDALPLDEVPLDDNHACQPDKQSEEPAWDRLIAMFSEVHPASAEIVAWISDEPRGVRTFSGAADDRGVSRQRIDQILDAGVERASRTIAARDEEAAGLQWPWSAIPARSLHSVEYAMAKLHSLGATRRINSSVQCRQSTTGTARFRLADGLVLDLKADEGVVQLRLMRGMDETVIDTVRQNRAAYEGALRGILPEFDPIPPCPSEAFCGQGGTERRREACRNAMAAAVNEELAKGDRKDIITRIVETIRDMHEVMHRKATQPEQEPRGQRSSRHMPGQPAKGWKRPSDRRVQVSRSPGDKTPRGGSVERAQSPTSTPATVATAAGGAPAITMGGIVYVAGDLFPHDAGGCRPGDPVGAAVHDGRLRVATPAGHRFWEPHSDGS